MRPFKSFLLSERTRLFESEAVTAYHTSTNPIHGVDHRPMMFSLNKHQADGWHNYTKDEAGGAHTYQAKIRGNIAHHTDEKVKDVFRKAGVNQNDYHADLASSPSHKEIKNHPGTKALQAAGHHGYVFPHYDAHNFNKDADHMVSFHPSKHVSIKSKYKEN